VAQRDARPLDVVCLQTKLGANTLNVSVVDVSDGLLDTVVFIQGGSLKVRPCMLVPQRVLTCACA
jgi:hypothetical protein